MNDRNYITDAVAAINSDLTFDSWNRTERIIAAIIVAQATDRQTEALERLIRITEDNILYRHEGADRRGFCCDGRPL